VSAPRPRAEPSEISAEFWEAAAEHRLVRPVCQECGNNFFSPQLACTNCLSENWLYEESSGEGVVYSATIIHRAPYPGFEAPFHLGVIDLDEGWSMLCNIIDDRSDPIPIGTRVAVTWLDADNGSAVPQFEVKNDQGGGS
jgi:hypothetical protein